MYDRTLFEDFVFADCLHEEGNMSEREFDTYKGLYDILCSNLEKPSYLIYLETSPDICMERLATRNRTLEFGCDGVTPEYLQALERAYQRFLVEFSKHTPVFKVNWSDYGDTKQLLAKINEIRNGDTKVTSGIITIVM